jgi:hypothetical protein
LAHGDREEGARVKYELPEQYQPKNLYAEYEADRKYWKAAVLLSLECARKAAGDMYWGNPMVSSPENYWLTHTLHTKAKLTQGTMNPRFTTKKRDVSERVENLEAFCRQWDKDTGFAYEYERLVDDLCFGGAVAMVQQKKRKGFEQFDDPPWTPAGQRLDIRLWSCDPVGGNYENARHAEHVSIHLHSEVIAMAEKNPHEWDLDAVKRMKEEPIASIRGLAPNPGVDRHEVSYVTMWCREYTLPDSDKAWRGVDKTKCHGTVFRFALCSSLFGILQSPELLGPPTPYYGPRTGPYIYEGFIDVPNEVRKSSPLIANGSLIEQLNATERAIDVLTNSAKTLVIVDGMPNSDPTVITKDGLTAIEDARHGEVVRVPGFSRDRIEVVQIGGPTPEAIAVADRRRAQVRRNLGMPDVGLGETGSGSTLGENQIADANLDLMTDAMDKRAKRLAGRVYMTAAWYAENDSRTVSQYDGETMLGGSTKADMEMSAGRALNAKMVTPEWHEQAVSEMPEDQGEPLNFEELDVTVERVKTDPQSLQRFQQATEFVTVAAPLAPLFAQLGAQGFEKFMERAADEYGVSELATLFDMEAAAEMPVPGQEDEAPREAPAPEQPQMRQSPGSSGRGAPAQSGSKPAGKPAPKMRAVK